MSPRVSAPDEGLPLQVDKETNTEEAEDAGLAVRPKERSGLSARQRPLVRSSVIVRSQTFSPGERSQYICRVRTGPWAGRNMVHARDMHMWWASQTPTTDRNR